MPKTRYTFHLRLTSPVGSVILLLVGILTAISDQRAQGPGQIVPASPPVATITPKPARTWTDTPGSKPENLVTIHYHRQDGKYEEADIWTWDGNQKKTPTHNELASIGRDDFGLVFQLDRANYSGSDKIGLITRLGHDWSHKDGGDKIWTAALGNEVWLVGGKNEVLTKAPDLSPHMEAAYIDGPSALVVSLTDPAPSPASVSIIDQNGAVHPAESAFPMGTAGQPASAVATSSFNLIVIPAEALDVANGRYRVQVEGFGAAVPLVPRGVLDNRELFYDAAARLGAVYSPQGTTFRVFAPTASSVSLVLYDEAVGEKGRTARTLKKQSQGLWDVTVDGDLRGKFYVYLLDGPGLSPTREVLDPYAANTVASSTRGLITEMVPPARPSPAIASPTDAIIYEMHVRDFTVARNAGVKNSGLYLGFTEPGTHLASDTAIRTTLDHLTELGVTHVQLLPVQDFEDNEADPKYNWGYIPSAYFSPEGAYATNPNDDSRVCEFKALVDALHARGIGVIMDVVYNHTASDASFQSLVPGYYYRHVGGALADGSGCGNEFRTEAPMARKLILDSLAYWTREYGIDGFRFDLMSLIDQDTVRQAERELRAINPNILLFGEPWSAGPTPLQDKSDKAAIRQLPVGAFNDNFRNALKGSPDGRDPGFIQNGSNRDALKSAMLVTDWFASPGQSINYMTCHDNLVLWDKLKISMPNADDTMLVETMKLGYLALFTSQGVPLFQGGEEFARSKGGNNNSYEAPDSVNEVDWSLKRKHFDLFTYTRDAIALRKAHTVFRLRTREDIAARLKFANTSGGKTLLYTLDASGVPGETWKRVCVVLNTDDQSPVEITLPEGQWLVAMDEHGAAADRSVAGKVNVRQKSGLVLYQR